MVVFLATDVFVASGDDGRGLFELDLVELGVEVPTPSGTSDSHAVPVRHRAAARVLIHEVVVLLGSLGYPLRPLGDITQRS